MDSRSADELGDEVERDRAVGQQRGRVRSSPRGLTGEATGGATRSVPRPITREKAFAERGQFRVEDLACARSATRSPSRRA